MNSVEKVRAAINAAENVADQDDAEPQVRAAAGMVVFGRRQIERLIPTDPDELDALLEKGEQWMRSLRSDPPAA